MAITNEGNTSSGIIRAGIRVSITRIRIGTANLCRQKNASQATTRKQESRYITSPMF